MYNIVLSGLAILLAAILVIFGGLLFTNSIEFLASKYRIGQTLVGAVISPILTSLPELTVIIVALAHGGLQGSEISIGTIIGEPFMASTIVYPLIILSSFLGYLKGRRESPVLRPSRDLYLPFLVFSILFPLILVPVFIRCCYLKYVFAVLMLVSYFVYVYNVARRGKSELFEESIEDFLFAKIFGYHICFAFIQLAISVLLIYVGSEGLVKGLIALSQQFHIDAQTLSIIIVPSVAALPESVVGLVWAYRGRDTLALASVVGEKILYSTFYPSVGMFVTEWYLNTEALFCVLFTTFISILMLMYILRQRIGYEMALIGLSGYVAYCLTAFHVL